MIKTLLFITLILTFTKVYGQESSFSLIPLPAEIQKTGSSFQLTSSTAISFNTPEARNIAEMLAKKLNTPTGFSIKVQQNGLPEQYS